MSNVEERHGVQLMYRTLPEDQSVSPREGSLRYLLREELRWSLSLIGCPLLAHFKLSIPRPFLTHFLPIPHPFLTHFSPIPRPFFYPFLAHFFPIPHTLLARSSPNFYPSLTHFSPTSHPFLTLLSPTLHPYITQSSSIYHTFLPSPQLFPSLSLTSNPPPFLTQTTNGKLPDSSAA